MAQHTSGGIVHGSGFEQWANVLRNRTHCEIETPIPVDLNEKQWANMLRNRTHLNNRQITSLIPHPNYFDVDLNEKQWANMLRNRTHREIARLILHRVLVNCLVCVILALSLVAIYYGTSYSVDNAREDDDYIEGSQNFNEFLHQLVIKFLPAILTTLLNIVIPFIFEFIMSYEKYSLNMEVIILLARTVIVRLTLVGVLILSLYLKLQTDRPPDYYRVVHKTVIVRLTLVGVLILSLYLKLQTDRPPDYYKMKLECVRGSPLDVLQNCINKTLTSECASKKINRIMGKGDRLTEYLAVTSLAEEMFVSRFCFRLKTEEHVGMWLYLRYRERSTFIDKNFALPFYIVYHVLDLIYCQSLCWFGAFFCPYISIWTMVKLVIYFYIKKVSLMKNCVPPVRVYRSSRSNAFFMKVLLLTFISCSVLIGYIFGNIPPSQGCGPFRIYINENHMMTSTITALVTTFPSPVIGFIHFVTSTAFILPLLIIMTGSMYYNWTMGMFNIRYARQLKVDLALEGRDKQQLVKMIKDLDDQMRKAEKADLDMTSLGDDLMEFTKEEADEMRRAFSLFDKDGDGTITASELGKMLRAFSLFDKDGDGTITASELGPIMRALGLNPTEKCIEKLLKRCDTNQDGTIDFEEYTNLMKEYTKSPEDEEEELKSAFLYFDHDRDGFISVKELVMALTVTGEKMDKRQVRNIISQFDTDGDGKLGYNEFAKFLCQKY